MKKLLLLILVLAILFCSASAFSDIKDSALAADAQQLSNFGIINGYGDGSFKPDNTITRAEFSKIICTVCNFENQSGDTSSFHDVALDHWAKNYIYTAKSMEIVNGTTLTTFTPEAHITYEQAIKMIVAALGYNKEAIEKGGYPDGYIQVANDLGLLTDVEYAAKDSATRGNIVKIIRNALDVPFYFLSVENGTVVREKSSITLFELLTISTPSPEFENESFLDEETGTTNETDATDGVG